MQLATKEEYAVALSVHIRLERNFKTDRVGLNELHSITKNSFYRDLFKRYQDRLYSKNYMNLLSGAIANFKSKKEFAGQEVRRKRLHCTNHSCF